MSDGRAPWLPDDYVHPEHVELATGHHIRPIRESDTDIDYPAVMDSRERLWSIFGPMWGWPPADLTYEDDQQELARHEREIRDHISFNYAVLDEAESRLLGCIYVDPCEAGDDADAEVSWWLVDEETGGPLDAALAEFVPRWLSEAWPFTRTRCTARNGPPTS